MKEKNMKKFHLALSVTSISETVADYTKKLGQAPVRVIKDSYALWRTQTLNVSVKCDPAKAGHLRHLGWEDPSAEEFIVHRDVNGIE
jgi:hypothetical protein